MLFIVEISVLMFRMLIFFYRSSLGRNGRKQDKNKKFGQGVKKLYIITAMVATIAIHRDCDSKPEEGCCNQRLV